ncbi:MAG: hypothetical protein WCS85_05405 [Candidatus Peribacteraceae bacterium]
MNILRSRDGYVLLISVLAIGLIASSTVASLLLLGGASEKTAWSTSLSLQAMENARTCVERAFLELRADPTYAGDASLTLPNGSCELRPVGGTGNDTRTICASGEKMGVTRRLEVQAATIFPRLEIDFWREVASFTLCP